MVDISAKQNTNRSAIAMAIVEASSAETILAVIENKVPKGNALEIAKAAGLLAIKNTSQVIPDCHPIPVEFGSVKYSITERTIEIHVEVRTFYKTGVEVEAMHGAAVVALTLYDMLKPIDKKIAIREVKLLEKRGGKTDYRLHEECQSLEAENK